MLRDISGELNRSPADIALAWVAGRDGSTPCWSVRAPPEQLDGGLNAVDHPLPEQARRRLDEVGAPELGSPDELFTDRMTATIAGGGNPVRHRRG